MRDPIIKIRDVSYRYQRTGVLALSHLTCAIPRGKWVTILGRNGSGKSTLVRIMDGLLSPNEGTIEIDGDLVSAAKIWRIRSKLGIIFQNPADQFVGATVEDDLAFGLANYRISPDRAAAVINRSLELVHMLPFRNHSLRNLSGGQRQRVALAEVLAIRPKIIILDESTSMLDPDGRIQILNLIDRLRRSLRLTVIDITHQVDEVYRANWVMIMAAGHLKAAGTVHQVLRQLTVFKRSGLTIPQVDRLKMMLLRRGVRLPLGHLSETELLIWIQRLL